MLHSETLLCFLTENALETTKGRGKDIVSRKGQESLHVSRFASSSEIAVQSVLNHYSLRL